MNSLLLCAPAYDITGVIKATLATADPDSNLATLIHVHVPLSMNGGVQNRWQNRGTGAKRGEWGIMATEDGADGNKLMADVFHSSLRHHLFPESGGN